MGENAFIAFGIAAIGITWQQRLGAVFLGGALLLVITVLGLRSWRRRHRAPAGRGERPDGRGDVLR